VVLGAALTATYYVQIRPPWWRPFRFDPGQPFTLEYGSGGGPTFGFVRTLVINERGLMTLAFTAAGEGGTTTRQLSSEQIRAIADALARHGVKDFHCSYAEGCGSWLALRIRQGGYQKSVYGYLEWPKPIAGLIHEMGRILGDTIWNGPFSPHLPVTVTNQFWEMWTEMPPRRTEPFGF
jgi:hypothetical protein